MKCQKHNKDVITNCQWCGKSLCRLCIAKTNSRKAYCSNCATRVGSFVEKKQLEQIKAEEEKEKTPSSNEYFNFSALKER